MRFQSFSHHFENSTTSVPQKRVIQVLNDIGGKWMNCRFKHISGEGPMKRRWSCPTWCKLWIAGSKRSRLADHLCPPASLLKRKSDTKWPRNTLSHVSRLRFTSDHALKSFGRSDMPGREYQPKVSPITKRTASGLKSFLSKLIWYATYSMARQSESVHIYWIISRDAT